MAIKRKTCGGINSYAITVVAATALNLLLAGAVPAFEAPGQGKGEWLSGDFHQHTTYTDGSTSFDFV